MQGLIIKSISNEYTILSDNKTYICKQRGKLKYQKNKILVGDTVVFNEDLLIEEIKPRKNELNRPAISNVDQAYIITCLKPNLDLNLLDKLLVLISYNNIEPIICFTKYDLLNTEEKKDFDVIKKYYESIGISVYLNNDTDNIKDSLKSKISVFTGQTGAGKSTLLNHLDETLHLRTNEISKALNRGKNTTTHVELLNIGDGWVADTPGFSSVYLDMDNLCIRDNMIEFNEYKDKCKYRDCMHDKEEDCYVKQMVKENVILKSRYDNYLKFISR